ncbi:MAG: DUF2085 domain-containing protein [Candidatus Thermoplasmatota archaeon]|nr:DUF2085 domain-containing protein [Candidatus Thermoplasmatota archaeon]
MTVNDLGGPIVDDRCRSLRIACHGDPDRCFWLRGRPLPLCSRCTTFYPSILIGLVLGIPLVITLEISALIVLISFILLQLPLVIDGFTQYNGWRRSNNVLRAVTGVLSGFGIGGGITYMMTTIF